MSERQRVHGHPVLGSVAFDPLMICWQTQSAVPLGDADEVVVALAVDSDLDIPVERLDEAAAIVRRLDPQTLRGAVAEQYLEVYNDTWRQDDDDELDRDGFIARITPTIVDIDIDVIQIYFNDGGLFAGHSLVMLLDTDLQVLDVKLAG
jgi:hypothetical protein